jgi:hypothetical protein
MDETLVAFLYIKTYSNKKSTILLWVFKIESAIALLKGQIHEALGCSDAAVECYKNALQADVYCFEALHALFSNHMLTPKEGINNLLSKTI